MWGVDVDGYRRAGAGVAGVRICERDVDGGAVLAVQTTQAWRKESVSAMRSRRSGLRATSLFGGTCNTLPHVQASQWHRRARNAESEADLAYATAFMGPFVVNSAPVDRMLPPDTSVGWKPKNS